MQLLYVFRFLMAAAMSKATVGSIVSILLYIVSFTPFMVLFTLDLSLRIWVKWTAVT